MCKFKAGYFETIITHKGEKHYKAKSISFDEMDNASFEEFYKKCIDVALELTGINQVDLEKQIINFIKYVSTYREIHEFDESHLLQLYNVLPTMH